MKLSKRIKKIAEMIESCGLMCDIGCDHGYVCIESVSLGKARRAIALDTAKGPLTAAQKNIAEAGLSDRITCVLSDGFKSISKEESIDCVTITGMGGRLIKDILETASSIFPHYSDIKQMVLGPQSETEVLRSFLINDPYHYILNETYLEEDGKYYVLMDVRVKESNPNIISEKYSQDEIFFGKYINPDCKEIYLDYLKNLKRINDNAIEAVGANKGENAKTRYEELKKIDELIGLRLKKGL